MACQNLGIANDFNVFVFNDHTQSSVDAEGRVAVGGTATYVNYGVGDRLPVSTERDDLIVQGDINITGGTNFSGNTITYPTGTITTYTMTNNNGVEGEPLVGTPINFDEAEAELTALSLNMAALTPTGTVANNFGQIVLTSANPSLNVFTINGEDVDGEGLALNRANGINIVSPVGSTIIINVAGDNIGFGSYQIFQNGISTDREEASFILWNFYQASRAFSENLTITGSLLAPYADWEAIGFGNINGTIVANSLTNVTGSLEGHNVPFLGCLPAQEGMTTTTTTPVPTTTTTTTTTTPVPTTTTTTSTTSTTSTSSTTTTSTTTTSVPTTTTTTTTTTAIPTTTTTASTTSTSSTTTASTTTSVPTTTTTTTTTTTAVPTTTTESTTSSTSTSSTSTSTSTTSTPAVTGPNIIGSKTANVTSAQLGEIITYTITLTNVGTAAGEALLTEEFPEGIVFIPSSLFIDGGRFSGVDIIDQVVIGFIDVGQTVVIEFQVLVAGFPLGGVIQNNGSIVSVTPGEVPATCSGEIAVIGLPNVPPNPDQLLPVLPNVKPGFTPLPGQTALTGPFLDAGGQVVLADPATVPGITLAPLPGLTIPFLTGTVNPIVSGNTVSVPRTPGLPFQNLVVIQPFLDVSLFVGQRITYTFFVINNGNRVSATTILKNSIPPNALFIRGTCQVNDEMRLDAEPDQGINLGPIPINQSVEVRFDLLITGGTSLANFCTVTAAFANQFTNTISTQTFQSDVITNPVLAVAASDLSTLIKTASVQTAVVGDVFQYNVTISNLSTDITAANVIFYDVLDMTLQYVSGSLTIDGVPQMDPQVGVTLGTIGPGVTRHLSFKVRSLLEPAGDHIVNTGVVFFEFRFGASCFRAGLLSNPSVIVITPEEEE